MGELELDNATKYKALATVMLIEYKRNWTKFCKWIIELFNLWKHIYMCAFVVIGM